MLSYWTIRTLNTAPQLYDLTRKSALKCERYSESQTVWHAASPSSSARMLLWLSSSLRHRFEQMESAAR